MLRGIRLAVEVIAHSKMKLRSERLTDGDLVDCGRMCGTTRDDSRAIHDGPEASIEGTGNCLQLWGAGKHQRT